MRLILVTGSPGVGKTTLQRIINNHFQTDCAIDTDTFGYHSNKGFLIDIEDLKVAIGKINGQAKVKTLYVLGFATNIIDVIDQIKPDFNIQLYRTDESIRFTLKERTDSECLFWSNMKSLVDIPANFKDFMNQVNNILSQRRMLKINISNVEIENILHAIISEDKSNKFSSSNELADYMTENYDLGFPHATVRSQSFSTKVLL